MEELKGHLVQIKFQEESNNTKKDVGFTVVKFSGNATCEFGFMLWDL